MRIPLKYASGGDVGDKQVPGDGDEQRSPKFCLISYTLGKLPYSKRLERYTGTYPRFFIILLIILS
jgi:hypothetical protein